MSNELFEKASRLKLRFPTTRGDITVEDLWDLPLGDKDTRSAVTLDSLAQHYHKKLKEQEETSFVKKITKTANLTELCFDLVKHIIEVRLQEQEDKVSAVQRKQHNEHIDALIAKKKDAQMENLSVEELEKLRQ